MAKKYIALALSIKLLPLTFELMTYQKCVLKIGELIHSGPVITWGAGERLGYTAILEYEMTVLAFLGKTALLYEIRIYVSILKALLYCI